MNSQIIAALLAFLSAVGVFVAGRVIEMRSVNTAILAEIRRLLDVLYAHEEWWSKLVEAKNTQFPLIPFFHASILKPTP